MDIILRNPKTGETRATKVGFSWTCFFGGGIGIPLFLRGLNVWGGVMLFLWGLSFFIYDDLTAIVPWWFMSMGLAIFLGIRANEMAVKNYLQNGWHFSGPDDATINYAKNKWGLYSDEDIESLKSTSDLKATDKAKFQKDKQELGESHTKPPAKQYETDLQSLEKLAELHSQGVLTDEEFLLQKRKILGS